jgi:hypothetical protein
MSSGRRLDSAAIDPDAIAAFSQSRPVYFGIRNRAPMAHVLDCLAGYLTLAEALSEDVETYPETGILVLRTGLAPGLLHRRGTCFPVSIEQACRIR